MSDVLDGMYPRDADPLGESDPFEALIVDARGGRAENTTTGWLKFIQRAGRRGPWRGIV